MRGLATEEVRNLLRSVGTHRGSRPLSPVEVAGLLRKALGAGATRRECAVRLQIGATQVATFLKLLRLVPEVQHLADWGSGSRKGIAFSSLALVADLPGDVQEVAARSIIEQRLSWKEVVQLTQIHRRSGDSLEECVRAVVGLRPRIDVRHVYIGTVISDEVKRGLSRRTQRERDELLEIILTKLGLSGDFDSRLGIQRFMISGHVDPTARLELDADTLEVRVNEYLAVVGSVR